MNSVVEISLPQQRVVDGAVFPLALTSSTISLVDWVEHHRDELDELLRKHRGILFRGFTNLKNHEEFHKIVEATGLNAMDYIGG